jgi:nicotinamidase-related amidase
LRKFEKLVPGATTGYFQRVNSTVLPNIKRLQDYFRSRNAPIILCVSQTARETADRGFQVIVAEDACTTLSEEMHRGALQSFQIAFGRVKKTDEILALLTSANVSAVGV